MSIPSLAKLRSNAREKALQALYQWTISAGNLSDIEAQFHAEQNMAKVDLDYFHAVLHGVPAELTELDALLAPFLTKQEDLLDHISQAILRLSAWELRHRLDVPYAVVIKEAIHLSRAFGAEQSHKFVNGVLDKLARELRSSEVKKTS